MEHISDSIYINKAAYFYLRAESRKQRGCKPLTEEQEERIWDRLYKGDRAGEDLYRADNMSFGGGDGSYNGRWWSWSVDTLKKMLTEAGYKFEEGKQVRYIDAY